MLTSGPFREGWKPYQAKGMPTVLAVSDDVQHLERGFVPEQKSLAGPEVFQRMRALAQNIGGTLALDDAALIACARSENLIERRLAIQALGKSKTASLAPLLAALSDPENGVRCGAALALAEKKNASAGGPLLRAVEQHGNHMLRECVIIALRRLQPLPVAELTAALRHPNDRVREVAMRSLLPQATAAMLPVFRAGLQDHDRFVRFIAVEALGSLGKNTEAIEVLLAALHHEDPAVVSRAAVSLGKLAALKRPETEALRPRMFAALLAAFRQAPADGWSFRPIGNAILDFDSEGAAALRELRDQRDDARLAELAWRVVDLTQRPNSFTRRTAAAELPLFA